jgi:hypothetical protein
MENSSKDKPSTVYHVLKAADATAETADAVPRKFSKREDTSEMCFNLSESSNESKLVLI